MKRRVLAMLVYAWVLWVQTRTSEPQHPITDAWEIVDTFRTQEECERARVAIGPPAVTPEVTPRGGTRYVCFPDTLDPRATP